MWSRGVVALLAVAFLGAPFGVATTPSPPESAAAPEIRTRPDTAIAESAPRATATPNWPSPRVGHAMVYHPTLARLFLFGGSTEFSRTGSGANSETWLYDPSNGTWELVTSSLPPPARLDHAMVFDKAAGLVILFGGRTFPRPPGVRSVLNDTWVYEVASGWRQAQPNRSPTPREGAVMVHDHALGRNVLFGGFAREGYSNETWSYDGAAAVWTELRPRTPPDGSVFSGALAYHAASGKIITLAQGDHLQTWAYDSAVNAWTRTNSTVVPGFRWSTALVDHPPSGRLLLFGGDAGGHADGFGAVPDTLFHHDDTWTYDVAADAWTQIDRTPFPGDLADHAMAHDSASGRVFLFGGGLGTCPYFNDELWSYDLAGGWTGRDHRIVPAAPRNVGWTSGEGYVTLNWEPPRLDGESAILGYLIYWTKLDDFGLGSNVSVIDVGNVLTHTHRGLTDDGRYQYQVAAVNEQGGGELSCSVRADVTAPPMANPVPVALDVRILWASAAGAIALTSVVVLRLWRRRKRGV